MGRRVAIVTGSSRGIGRETARILAERGAHVILNGRDGKRVEATAAELRAEGLEVSLRAGDVSRVECARDLVESTVHAHGRLDILVNNAGISQRGYFWEQDPEVVRAMVEVNFMGVALPTRFALPYVEATAGSILVVSSLAALRGLPGNSTYSAAKMAQTALVEALRTELAFERKDVHVGIVYVGVTQNDPDKTILGPHGEPVALRERPSGAGQRAVAEVVADAIERRRFKTYVGLQGRLVGWVTRHLPWLAELGIRSSRRRVQRMLR